MVGLTLGSNEQVQREKRGRVQGGGDTPQPGQRGPGSTRSPSPPSPLCLSPSHSLVVPACYLYHREPFTRLPHPPPLPRLSPSPHIASALPDSLVVPLPPRSTRPLHPAVWLPLRLLHSTLGEPSHPLWHPLHHQRFSFARGDSLPSWSPPPTSTSASPRPRMMKTAVINSINLSIPLARALAPSLEGAVHLAAVTKNTCAIS
ncbi:hypothetical protein DMC30DRAFT_275409 [Rhodotorula diobovata]|uniref:Uncharacterized protein n=1 Tax=Rhodotorula diobovata TaxID=5288 RepID=A0A5C5FSW6_9BASI|nr:hypothetical protein DMC30DRAFT_275409 [Rhodotorula diobovata]